MAVVKVESLPFYSICAAACEEMDKIEAFKNETMVWINEVIQGGKNTMHSDGVALLPKTPSAATARKSRRRVQRRSSAANTVVRRNLRSTMIQTVSEQDESIADISTDSTISNKGRRKRGIKANAKAEDVKQKKVALQEITNCSQDEDKDPVGKNTSSSAKSDNTAKGENKENNQKSAANDNTDILNILQATLEISDKIVKDKHKNQGKVLQLIKSKSPSVSSQEVQSASTSAVVINVNGNSSNNDGTVFERKSSDKKLNSEAVVMINSAEVKERLSKQEKGSCSLESSYDSNNRASGRSSRRSSTVKKAKLNVARLSTSRRSIKIHTAKPPVQQDFITASAIKAAKNPSGKQSSHQTKGEVRVTRSKLRVVKKSSAPVVIAVDDDDGDGDDDDDDDTMIEDTPPTAKQLQSQAPRTTRSKMTAAAASKTTANRATAAVAVNDAAVSRAAAVAASATEAVAEEAVRTTRSKTRVMEIEKVLTGAATNNKINKQALPATPGRNIGSRVQQLQQLLCQDEGFGLRPKPVTPRVEPQRKRSIKRNLEAAASPGRAVTPKRSCRNGKEATGADAAGGTKTRTLQMSNGSSHVRSVIAGVKKTSTMPNNAVTSFIQRTTPKVPTHEEVLEQKRKEISEKERKHNALIQRRNEEQQRRLEEIRRIRDTHQKRVQIRRMELEQAVANKKYTSAQKSESTVSRLVNKADDIQKSDEILRKLAEEEESITRQLAATTESAGDGVSISTEWKIATRSSAGRVESNKDTVSDIDRAEVDEAEEQKNSEAAEKERDRLERERLEKEKAEEKSREKAVKEKQQKELLELQAKQAEQERERDRIRIEKEQKERERRERLLQEEKLKQEQELLRLKAERERLEREQQKAELEKQRQREQEKIMKARQEAKQKLEEDQALERSRLEAERRMKEEQLRILQEKQKEAAAKLNMSSINGSSCKMMSVSVTDINKQYKGNATSVSGNTSKAMRISHAEASRPVATGGPVRVATTSTKANSTAVHNTSATTIVKQPTTAKATVKQDGQKAFNRTFDKEGDTDSYDMTPGMRRKKKFAPSTEDNYNIDDIDSGDETDDEENPRKRIPAWAQGVMLKAALIDLEAKSLDGHRIFGSIAMLDLNVVFKKKKERFNKRTSSAVWDEFPSFTRP